MRSQCVRMVLPMRSHCLFPMPYTQRGSAGLRGGDTRRTEREKADLGRCPDLICQQHERLLQGRRVDGAAISGVFLCNPWKQLRPDAAKLFRPGVGDYRCTKSVLERLQVAAMRWLPIEPPQLKNLVRADWMGFSERREPATPSQTGMDLLRQAVEPYADAA